MRARSKTSDFQSWAVFALKLLAGSVAALVSLVFAIFLGGFLQPLLEKVIEDEGFFGEAGERIRPLVELSLDILGSPLVSYSLTAVFATGVGVVYARWLIGTLREDGPDHRFRVTSPADLVSALELPILGYTLRDNRPYNQNVAVNPSSGAFETAGQLASMLGRWTKTFNSRVIVFTGDQPTVGKTTAVVGAARALSRYGKRVLVMDCDLRNPSVHRVCGGESATSMSRLLTQGGLEIAPKKDQFSDAMILTCGPIPSDPAALFATGLERLLDRVRPTYDYILLDSPPFAFAEVLTITEIADGFVFVVEHGSNLKAARLVLDRIREMNDTPGGLLMSKLPTKGVGATAWGIHAYEYSYGYGYRYGQAAKGAVEGLSANAAVSGSSKA